ncbi:hypothetical protein S7335_2238 [Synechococcus sp. PCC 7335]|uniref:hypothetical protein n=1 Tax=Synechococcus sp. (strain ATCC 29403 / PCC 7335) TaxID=91464 RepID=UPI00017EE803|nr:hypothetical protein [Synechococcus sp. PCC 7335]EDX84541.1 hypothetical protein S7335_2238 [Synechococcus sp. PCC 7335]
MPAPTFETLSAELNQALSKRHDIPSETTARCTQGRNKVMVLIEYPSAEGNDVKKLTVQTLDWLEDYLRHYFNVVGLPSELADLSAIANEVVVQLYLKYQNTSSPFTMRSFTWKIEDGFADLFGHSDFDRSTSFTTPDYSSVEELDLTSDDLRSEGNFVSAFSADSASDLFADLSEGISQENQQSSDELMEFLVSDEVPTVPSSELDLPAVELPVSSYLESERASDFFELDQENLSPKATVDLFDFMASSESEDLALEELTDETLGSTAEFEADFFIEDSLIDDVLYADEFVEDQGPKPIDEASLHPSEVGSSTNIESIEEDRIEDNLVDEQEVGSKVEESEPKVSKLPVVSDESELEASEPGTLPSTQETESDLALTDLGLNPSEPVAESSEPVAESEAPEQVTESKKPEFKKRESSEIAEPIDPTVEASIPFNLSLEASTVRRPEELKLEEKIALNDPFSQETSEINPTEETATDDFGTKDWAKDNESDQLDLSDHGDDETIPFEYDEAEALPSIRTSLGDADEGYLEHDYTTEAYIGDSREAKNREDYEGDRAQPTHSTDKGIATVEAEQWQGKRSSQRSGKKAWAFVGLLGILMTGILGFGLTRPCSIGQCDRLETARIESDEALAQLRQDNSAASIQAAQQSIRRSIQQLEPIPVWSSYYDEAQTAILEYERQLNALDLVSVAQGTAYSAAVQSQDPPHSASTWEEIASQWQEAIVGLSSVPDNGPVYELAQTKLTEYRANLSTIRLRVRIESTAEENLSQAQQSATQAAQKSETAASAEAWETVVKDWQTAINSLRQIPQGTQAYFEVQEILPKYEQRLREARDRAEKERSASEQGTRIDSSFIRG